MSRRKFAQDTQVSITRSRGAIDKLLREWGASGVQWTDNWDTGDVMLRFVWRYEEQGYVARINVKVPSDEELKEQAVDGRTHQFSQGKMDKLRDQRGKQEHRLLVLWLKAVFNAVEAGIVEAEVLFLPFLEDRRGRTMAEVSMNHFRELPNVNGDRLLAAISRTEEDKKK